MVIGTCSFFDPCLHVSSQTLLESICISYPRPSGKFLVLFDEEKGKSRFLIGRELLILMGIPINRMVDLDKTAEKVLSMNKC